jgi:RNA 2',3'-cyclic 3'-phosphodiesterase
MMAHAGMMRLFFAVFPPPEVQRAAFALEEALRRPGDLVSWVKVENLHYTMRFMGDLGADGARRCAEAAAEAAADVSAFDATLGGLGAFPNARKARVLWVGMARGAEPLEALAKGLEAALRRRGFERADRAFSAHLTIGRARNPGEDWTPRLAAIEAPDPSAARFRVDRLLLMESRLSPKGSTYTVREEAELMGTA